MGFWTSMLSLVLVCSNSVQCSCGHVSLKCNSDNQGQFGHQSLLECVVNVLEEARDAGDAQITQVLWAKEGTRLIGYEIGVLQSEPRFTFAEPHWKATMNVSMLVNETKIADVGNYSCLVFTNRGHCTTSVSLNVSAPYSDPIISSVMEDKRVNSLSCHANGGYPKGTIDWFDENSTRLTPSCEQEAIQTGDGLFILTSTLDWPPDSQFYTCVVNGIGGQEGEARFLHTLQMVGEGPQTTDVASKVVPPVLCVLLVIGVLVFLMKRNQRGSQTASEAIEMADQDNDSQPMAGRVVAS